MTFEKKQSTSQGDVLAAAPDSGSTPSAVTIRFLKGILIGIGAILPGLSAGVLIVIFDYYDPLIHFLSNIKKQFLRNVRFFLPIGIGGFIGILLFSVFVEKAFGQYAAQFVCLFIGFVIGTFPSLYREAGKQGQGAADIVIFLIAAGAVIYLMRLGEGFPQIQPSIAVWFIVGAVVSLDFMLPGISPSNYLIYFGLYDKLAAAINAFDFSMLIPFVTGAIGCVLLFSKLMKHLFDKHHAKMYHIVLGLVVGSTIGIFPAVILPAYTASGLAAAHLSLTAAILFGGALLLAGIISSYLFSRLEDRVKSTGEDIDGDVNK